MEPTSRSQFPRLPISLFVPYSQRFSNTDLKDTFTLRNLTGRSRSISVPASAPSCRGCHPLIIEVIPTPLHIFCLSFPNMSLQVHHYPTVAYVIFSLELSAFSCTPPPRGCQSHSIRQSKHVTLLNTRLVHLSKAHSGLTQSIT